MTEKEMVKPFALTDQYMAEDFRLPVHVSIKPPGTVRADAEQIRKTDILV